MVSSACESFSAPRKKKVSKSPPTTTFPSSPNYLSIMPRTASVRSRSSGASRRRCRRLRALRVGDGEEWKDVAFDSKLVSWREVGWPAAPTGGLPNSESVTRLLPAHPAAESFGRRTVRSHGPHRSRQRQAQRWQVLLPHGRSGWVVKGSWRQTCQPELAGSSSPQNPPAGQTVAGGQQVGVKFAQKSSLLAGAAVLSLGERGDRGGLGASK